MSGAADFGRVRSVFEAALDLPADERSAFVERECAGDAQLEREVRALLASDTVEVPGDDPLTPAGVARYVARSHLEGARIGGFLLGHVLGGGGMGTVYAATEERLARTVALKVLNLGLFGPDQLRRFEFEAEMLGRLRHPAIAQVYASGVARLGDGPGAVEVPYIAMELIEGARDLVTFAREEDLGIPERIELFLHVVEALEHAHGRGVVHRDVKAGNLLVDGEGRVKVIDFGIAYADRSSSELTRTGMLLGTLGTMAPEQLGDGSSRTIDARADVYALGAVLYRLLTGRPPLELNDLPVVEAVARIREEIPQAPSRVATDLPQELAPELDWVVLRALEKEPERRYSSAAALGRDLERFLAHEPVTARPASRLYRAKLFTRRHRTLVVAVSVVLLALTTGLGFTTWGLVRAVRAERAADARLAEREELNTFLEDLLSSPDPGFDGYDVRVVDVLDRAAERLDSGEDLTPSIERSQRETLVRAYHSLGQWEATLEQLDRVAALEDGAAPEERHEWKRTRSSCLVELQRFDEAADLAREFCASTAPEPERTLDRELGTLLLGQVHVASTEYVEAIQLLEPLVAEWRDREPLGRDFVVALSALTKAMHWSGRRDEALALAEEGVGIREAEFGPDHASTAIAYTDLALLLIDLGQAERAVAILEEQLERHGEAYGPTHPWVLRWRTSLAAAAAKAGDGEKARAQMHTALTSALEAFGEENETYLEILGADAGLNFLLGDLAATEEAYRRWIEVARSLLGEGHPEVRRHVRIIATLMQKRGRIDESLTYHEGETERMARAVGETDVVAAMRADRDGLAARAERERAARADPAEPSAAEGAPAAGGSSAEE